MQPHVVLPVEVLFVPIGILGVVAGANRFHADFFLRVRVAQRLGQRGVDALHGMGHLHGGNAPSYKNPLVEGVYY